MAIPEIYMKNRKSAADATAARATAISKQQVVDAELTKLAATNFAKYETEYKQIEATHNKSVADAEKQGGFFIKAEPKVLLVIRIKGITKMSPQQKQIMALFRLKTINSAVFIKANKATLNALRYVAHFVTWGAPTVDTIRNLMYVRGYGKLNKDRVPIVDNSVIDKAIGETGIRTIEDLIHEIFTCGENFKKANNFIWPFKLNSRRLVDKRVNFSEGGDHGFRGDYINEFISKML
ncbi:Ribosomal protein L7 [Spironucleus salmonicida]|uniref:Ribosomal protein L7 n=1 Tax=Spironucleus salmonicida TaxID=348837 RepID=V6LF62_9EUKA|nr:Ribosomal protein L7 [Spironucleus salmonicida]|eukprot:EST43142.1 Ribosomal protein L7 [Spironucleus salmonicida]